MGGGKFIADVLNPPANAPVPATPGLGWAELTARKNDDTRTANNVARIRYADENYRNAVEAKTKKKQPWNPFDIFLNKVGSTIDGGGR